MLLFNMINSLHHMEGESNRASGQAGKNKPSISIMVNNKEVSFQDHQVTGAELKATAVSQGVGIQIDFALFEKKGGNLKPIGDDEKITIHPNQVFVAVAPDDNSMFVYDTRGK